MSETTTAEVIELNRQLLQSIASGDWDKYQDLCDDTLTCFEPEARGHLVKGLDFHKFSFDLGVSDGPRTTTMSSPKVRLMGDVAVVTYIRLVQYLDENSSPVTTHYEETRIWERQKGRWQHVHFHRSPCGG